MASIRVKPGSNSNTHHLSLSGRGRKYGLKFARGAKSILETPLQPSNVLITPGGRKFGDFDPSFSHIEIRDWTGGRGNEFHTDDQSAYYDGYGWSLTPGKLHNAPLWSFSKISAAGVGDYYIGSKKTSNNVIWNMLNPGQEYARSWNTSAVSFSSGMRLSFYLRKVGDPNDLQFAIYNSTVSGLSTVPGQSVASITVTSSSYEEYVPQHIVVDLGDFAAALSSGSTAFVSIQALSSVGGSTDTRVHYWEIACDTSSAAGSNAWSKVVSWSTDGALNFYFRAASNPGDTIWHLFQMQRSLYAISERRDGGDAHLLINGDRGKASSGATTAALNDASKTWAADMWAGAMVAIVRGDGAGQYSKISSNGSTFLASTWAIAPTSNSEYVIYDTDIWQELSSALLSSIGPTSGSTVVKSVTVAGSIAYFALGGSTAIGKLTWASSVHQSAKDGTNVADILTFFNDPINGPQIYRAISSNGQVSRASTQGFSSSLSFQTGIQLGSTEFQFTNMTDYNDQLYAFKEDGIWTIRDDLTGKLNIGLEGHTSSNNGRAVLSQNLFLYLSWSHSLERLYAGAIDDIGPWRGTGLKDGHQGPVSALAPVIAWTAAAVDAGSTGVGSVMLWNGRGWHEIMRMPSSKYNPRSLFFQSNPGARPRLWVGTEDLISIQFPKDTLAPHADKSLKYWPDFMYEMSAIDMNNVQLNKLFQKLDVQSKNLSSVTYVYIDYQLDDDIGSTKWTVAGKATRSPTDPVNIRRGEKHAIRIRVRGITESSTTPAEINALTLSAVSRTPVKRLWTIRGKIGDFEVNAQGMQDTDPDEFYLWLQDVATRTEPLYMRSAWSVMDKIYVYAEHPTLNRDYTTPEGEWGGTFQIRLREI